MPLTKMLLIRDEGTAIPALAVRPDAFGPLIEQTLWERAGFGKPATAAGYVMLTRLSGPLQTEHSWGNWNDRTMRAAHRLLEERWDRIRSGDLDVTTQARRLVGLDPLPARLSVDRAQPLTAYGHGS